MFRIFILVVLDVSMMAGVFPKIDDNNNNNNNINNNNNNNNNNDNNI